GEQSVSDILAGTARHVVEGTRASWAGLALIGESDTFDFGGAYGPGGTEVGFANEGYRAVQAAPAERYLDAMSAGTMRLGGVPGRAVTTMRTTWEQDPILSTHGQALLQHDWQSAVSVPLAYDNRVIGALMVLLPVGATTLTDAEAAFCTAMADHAAIAVANERLSRQAACSAELQERGRVARELHDSVSQALFAMTMHARAAELTVLRAGLSRTPLARSLEQLSQLSRGTLAEMRALIVELRPEALTDEGLVRALRTCAAAISARGHLSISVDGPAGRLPICADVEADLYRFVSTALRDLEQDGADTAAVTLQVDQQELTVTLVDGSLGYDETTRPSLAIMTERAAAIGAVLEVGSGAPTTVSIAVALRAPAEKDRTHP
ncbi:MAG: GAF domain-containing protein, partial [Propionibacteriaceae bacterium]